MKPYLTFLLLFIVFATTRLYSQTCDNWLKVTNQTDAIRIGDLDVSGKTITVEAMFNRTLPLGSDLSGGDVVSKHNGASDCNYLLRGNQAEITTTDGYFAAVAPCGLELNKTFHIALVYDGSTLKYYRNGFLMRQVSATGDLIQNDFITTIGDYARTPNGTQENMSGYINEVRIWNTARSQVQLRTYMNSPLPTPSSQVGLLAYYQFGDLLNKQGNANWNGAINGNAQINQTNPTCAQFIADSCAVANSALVLPGFNVPDSVCVKEPFQITNTSLGVSNYYWSFCAADLKTTFPVADDLGNVSGNFSQPVFMDYVYSNNNYYGFVVNHIPGGLVRLDFGNSLLNTPTSTNLGDFGGIIPTANGAEGIQIVQSEGNWYAIIVGGNTSQGTPPRVLKIDFGANIANPAPLATNWGNLGNMEQPIDLHVFKEGSNWYGLTVNAATNSITRFSFTNSFNNLPTATNLGNIGSISYPTGIYALNDGGSWKVFITNAGDANATGSSLTRLDFGSSLLNIPTGVNLGNPGNSLKQPRDLTIMQSCGQVLGFVVNGAPGANDLVRLDFNNDLLSTPSATSLGNLGALNFPHSISKLFRAGNDVYGFVTNVTSNTIIRLKFPGCSNSSIPGFTAATPPVLSYDLPGTYTITLAVDIGLPTQSTICKTVVVKQCYDSIIVTHDTTICRGSQLSLNAVSALAYSWTPSGSLDNANIRNPTARPYDSTAYYVDALVATGNIITNGDFSQGNAGFVSGYAYVTSNSTEGEYTVGPKPQSWNPSFSNCKDHTTGGGNMMIVNGSPVPNVEVWKQVINVAPNTDYAFSTWIQSFGTANPASLSFSVNGVDIGTSITASMPPCTWTQFYAKWNSGANTSANISIVNKNSSIQGNDFGLDDISFSAAVTIRDSIKVNVEKQSVQAGNDTAVCAGSSVQLSATGSAVKYTWTPDLYLSSTSIANPVSTPAFGTQYVITAESARGCMATDTVNIGLYAKPTVVMANDTSVCLNSLIRLIAGGGVNYKWTPTNGLSDPNSPDPIASIKQSTTYSVLVTDSNNCTNTDSIIISVRPYPDFSTSGDVATCFRTPVTLHASGGTEYQWSPSIALQSPNSASTIANPDTTTNYSVSIEDSVCGFDTTINVLLTVRPSPSVTIQKSNDINCNTPIATLKASGAQSYVWTPAEGLNTQTGPTVEAIVEKTTLYKVTGTNDFGCSSVDSIMLTVAKDGIPRFVVPNAFTPNGDNRNDCFGIKRWGNAQIKEFSIFNRWGQLIFQTTDPSQCWDGTFKGKKQDSGSYAYIIRAVTLCGVVTRKGTLLLIR